MTTKIRGEAPHRTCFMRSIPLAGHAAAILVFAPLAVADGQTSTRTETPIYEVDNADGTTITAPRYSVEVRIDKREVPVLLDTGSVGLRLLHGAVAADSLTPAGPSKNYTYGSGLVLTGPPATAEAAVGVLAGNLDVQDVTSTSCTSSDPGCVGDLPFDKVRIGGNGKAFSGFRAVMGISLAVGTETVPNPLEALGAHQWIVRLPQPFTSTPGLLILNPRPDEKAGFTPLTTAAAAGSSGTINGCFMAGSSATPFCGPLTFDSGAPGIGIETGRQTVNLGTMGDAAALSISPPSGGTAINLGFTEGQPPAAATRVSSSTSTSPSIHAGVLPYYVFDVLYDADTGIISVRERRALDGLSVTD